MKLGIGQQIAQGREPGEKQTLRAEFSVQPILAAHNFQTAAWKVELEQVLFFIHGMKREFGSWIKGAGI